MRRAQRTLLLSTRDGIEVVSPVSIGTPSAATYPDDYYPRNPFLSVWAGKLRITHGDAAHNSAVSDIWSWDGETLSNTDNVTVVDHRIEGFAVKGGRAYLLGQDPISGTLGHLYYNVAVDDWDVLTPASLSSCEHIYSMDEDEVLWLGVGASSAGPAARRSTDGGLTWVSYNVPESGADLRTLRGWTLFKVGATRYLSTTALIFSSTPPGYNSTAPFISVFYWTGSQWDVTDFYFAPNDSLDLEFIEDPPGSEEYIIASGRIVKAVEFAGYTFYFTGRTITDHDFEPLTMYRIEASELTPERLTFAGSGKVYDLNVFNGALYALVNVRSGDRYTTRLYATTDGEQWQGVLEFTQAHDLIFGGSLAFYDGWAYIGNRCRYDEEAEGAGEIMKTRSRRLLLLGGQEAAVAPAITVQPASQNVTSGNTANLSVTATGTAPLTYQWYTGNSGDTSNPIGGATNSSYTTGALVNETKYWVRVTNAAGSVDSNAATMTVSPANTVAPAISGTATIGQTLSVSNGTWTGSTPSYTYQWKRGGSNIGSATNSTYQLVDADWGYTITCTVTATNAAGSANADSAATARVQEAPAQTLGSELLANPDFSAGASGANPTSWTVLGESGSDPDVSIVAPGGGAGTGACRLYNSATLAQPSINQAVLSAGSYYELSLLIDTVTAGSIRMFDSSAPTLGFVASTTGVKRTIGRAVGTAMRIRAEASNSNVVIDDASVKVITLNGQLTAPSANMRADFFYTLPGSPAEGAQLWLVARASDFASGNYWLAFLEYTGSQWNITLFSVAGHTRTSRTSATNIGATNGVRVNCNGDTLKLYTTANGGTNWTQRGSDVSNSTYNTATGVNALWVSTITPGNLVYAPAD